jgi:hypothetical protein
MVGFDLEADDALFDLFMLLRGALFPIFYLLYDSFYGSRTMRNLGSKGRYRPINLPDKIRYLRMVLIHPLVNLGGEPNEIIQGSSQPGGLLDHMIYGLGYASYSILVPLQNRIESGSYVLDRASQVFYGFGRVDQKGKEEDSRCTIVSQGLKELYIHCFPSLFMVLIGWRHVIYALPFLRYEGY